MSTVREAAGVFHDIDAMDAAADEMMRSGFDRAMLSRVSKRWIEETDVRAQAEADVETAREIEDDPSVPREAYVAPEAVPEAIGAVVGVCMGVPAFVTAAAVALTGGTLAETAGATALAAILGALAGFGVGVLIKRRRERLEEAELARGGAVLWVRTWNAKQAKKAEWILRRHSACDVHTHRS